MEDDVVRIAVSLRLGSQSCLPHTCSCGASVDARGSHGLSCSRSAGRAMRHAQINDIVHRALVKAKIPANKEPQGLIPNSSLRPDGVSPVLGPQVDVLHRT